MLALIAFAPVVAATKVRPETSTAPAPFGAFPVLPTVPNLNWADLPVKLTIQDVVTYNDNVFALPKGFPVAPGLTRGDFYNLTLVGLSSKLYMGQQRLTLNGAYGWTRYLHDSVANSSQYNLNGVLNWNFTSRCSGTLAASLSKLPSVAEEQIGSGINDVRLQSFSETAKCLVWGGFSVLANSGVTSSRNSSGLNRLVDSDSKYVSGGIGYDWSALDSSQILYRHSDTLYPNRQPNLQVQGLNLAREVVEDDVTASYTRYFSARLDATASAGLTRATLIPNGTTSEVAPHYSLSANWRPSDKIALRALISRSVGAPTSILANEQVSKVASLSASYFWTPKTTLTASFSVGSASGAFLDRFSGAPFVTQTNFVTAGLGASVIVTPFITGNLNYQYSDRRAPGVETVVNRVTLGMNYAPY